MSLQKQSQLIGNYRVNRNLTVQTLTIPNNTVTDSMVSPTAAIQTTKMDHRNSYDWQLFGPTTTITALTQWLKFVKGTTATLFAISAAIAVQATGADRTVDIDLQRSTAGGAFATVLTATIHITNATVIRTAVTGSFIAVSPVVGDIFQAVVTVAGAAGAQAQGLLLTLVMDEKPT